MALTPYTRAYGNLPLTQITPFTYRDGLTFLQILNEFEKWLREVTPEIEALLEENADYITGVEENWITLWTEFMENIVLELRALNDEAIGQLIGEPESKTRIALGSWLAPITDSLLVLIDGKVSIDTQVVSVLDHGAVKSSTVDSTAGFQAAANKLPNGGTLIVPAGDYLVNGEVKLNSNTHVSAYGARFIKNTVQSSYVVWALTAGTGAGKENVVIAGGVYQGNLTTGVTINCVTAHRASNLTVRDIVMRDYASNGHGVDLMGCDTVKVTGSIFEGFKPIAGREHTEAIQIDSSLRQGSGFSAATNSGEVFNGVPTRNVSVDNCVFRGHGAYRGQSPLGSHTWVHGNPMTNISFTNNHVEDTVSTVPSSYPAILHFIGTTDINISGNTFHGIPGLHNKVVRANRGIQGIALSEVNKETPVWSKAPIPVNIARVKIENNVIRDMSCPDDHLIHFYASAETRISDVSVIGNTFENCQTLGVSSGYLIQLSDCVSPIVSNNRFDSANGFVYFGTSTDALCTSNAGTGNTHYPVNAVECDGVSVIGNVFTGHEKGLTFTSDMVVTVVGNRVEVTGDHNGIQLVAVPARTTPFVISGNSVANTGSTSSTGIHATQSKYPQGALTGNAVRGYKPLSFTVAETVINVGNAGY